MSKFWLSTVSVLVITLASGSTVRAAAVNLNPAADAFVTTGPANNLSTNNYGGGGSIGLSAVGLPKGEFQSVLRFDTSSAKTTFDGLYGAGLWSLQSVSLQLTATAVNNTNFNANSAGSFAVNWMQNDGWTEGTGTPNAPGSAGITYSSLQGSFINPTADEALGTFSYSGASSGAFIYALNLTSGFTADLLAGDLVSLRLLAADGSVSYLFNSREFGTAANRPLLSITAVPEPGTVSLLILGSLMCAVRRWTRRWC
ncbi:MAG: PEP-CTERM sorting domain-containing protein [Verrucomicrobia bacterium]|nr:PEP-CTERM sorting domain-containing protein [Verrucomicrobiota bacterium]